MVLLPNLLGACLAIVATTTAAPAGTCAAPKPPPDSDTPTPGHEMTGIPMPDDFHRFQRIYQKKIRASLPSGNCTKKTIGKRRSWDELDDATRIDYLRAVNCLAAKPALTDKSLAPGAVNRLDDFTYIHINQTNIIHGSGYLLPWHRMFLWQFEEAMRNECGYKGHIPYWDNARFSEDPTSSAVWSGSETGFGSNGVDLHLEPKTLVFPGLTKPFKLPMPGGTGGGCVPDGPFKNLTLSLGPVVKTFVDKNNTYGYESNPRCLARNFDPASSKGVLTWANATTIVSSHSIGQVRGTIEGLWHKNSHTYIGGEGADPFSTTNDPAFYLLHAQIDRLWAIWQGQDLENRQYTIDGNRTFLGIPLTDAPDVPVSLATLDDVMDMGLGYKPKAKEGMPMITGNFCFIYE
ncbi:hypothetical protein PMIN06_011839 [Paraphaeosphaeria minitans]|uniref:Tyrosinase copper-binding domain-containing protein n=1 Tax=Paraphaeosphaeria minitans TaxID=565426 RepID=A0A9P6GNG8_9PLEO|nr:hypothetical protein PMIN01_04159 [Paraphaeosphaeria minitans]